MTEFPFIEGYTTPAGQVVLKFEGAEVKRTTKTYPYLVAFVTPVTRKYHGPTRTYVPCLPQVTIAKGTVHGHVAVAAARKAGRGAVVLIRKAEGRYEVL